MRVYLYTLSLKKARFCTHKKYNKQDFKTTKYKILACYVRRHIWIALPLLYKHLWKCWGEFKDHPKINSGQMHSSPFCIFLLIRFCLSYFEPSG